MKIAVIISTYNGQAYLREQLDSILNQESIDVELFVRDDGSSDGTRDILESYKTSYTNCHIEYGENLGFRQSFITELRIAEGFDYYAFSDQDDFWEKEKLYAAYSMISKIEEDKNLPIVYYSNLNVSDEKLNIYKKTKLENRHHSMESLIIRRSIAGCTMVFNSAMWECLNRVEIKSDMLRRGHDSFILSLCYAVRGKVICDSNAYIRYRQHMNNTSGSSYCITQRIRKEWNALVNKKGAEPAIAKSILENWAEMINDEDKKTLELVAENNDRLYCRMIIFFSLKFTSGDWKLTLLGKFRAIAGLL